VTASPVTTDRSKPLVEPSFQNRASIRLSDEHMGAVIVDTPTPVDISPEAVEMVCDTLYDASYVDYGLDTARDTLRALRAALTASEKDAAWLREISEETRERLRAARKKG